MEHRVSLGKLPQIVSRVSLQTTVSSGYGCTNYCTDYVELISVVESTMNGRRLWMVLSMTADTMHIYQHLTMKTTPEPSRSLVLSVKPEIVSEHLSLAKFSRFADRQIRQNIGMENMVNCILV